MAISIYSSNIVDAYDTSLTRTTASSLSVSRGNLATTTVDNFALFGGGYDDRGNSYYSPVDAYDTSLTRTTASSLSTIRGKLAATSIGNYALFGGGENYSAYLSIVDVYKCD